MRGVALRERESRETVRRMTKATNWDEYYKKPIGAANVSRAITRRKLVNGLRPFLQGPVSICEMGGANSCILDAMCKAFDIDHYYICDTNQFGLSLLPETYETTKITTSQSDILDADTVRDNKFDLVLSIGLIEHFNPADTMQAIHAHIAACKPGVYILLTFPTPTLPYRFIRRCAELMGVWAFHDERPLAPEEVLDALEHKVEIVHQSMNWLIGLTQYYVVARKPLTPNA